MLGLFVQNLYADGGFQGQNAGMMQFIIMWVLVVLVIYFLLIWPSKKREKQRAAQINALKKGDNVITNGGVYGVVHEIGNEDGCAKIEIANGVVIKILKSYLNPAEVVQHPVMKQAHVTKAEMEQKNFNKKDDKIAAQKADESVDQKINDKIIPINPNNAASKDDDSTNQQVMTDAEKDDVAKKLDISDKNEKIEVNSPENPASTNIKLENDENHLTNPENSAQNSGDATLSAADGRVSQPNKTQKTRKPRAKKAEPQNS